MIRRERLIAIAVVAGAACASHASRAPAAVGTALAAPALVSPAEGALLTFFPRAVDYRWDAVPGAARYDLEVDCYKCCAIDKWCSDVDARRVSAHETAATTYTDPFPGDQPGRWRVWAIDARGEPGAKSAWREFTFERPTPSPIAPGTFRDPATGEAVRGPGGPRAVFQPRPDYTQEALRARVSGDVLMSLIVDATGRVDSVRVIRSLRPDLDDSAVRTMRTWRFEPARRDGTAVAAQIEVSMSFYVK
jgi:TonB family protein